MPTARRGAKMTAATLRSLLDRLALPTETPAAAAVRVAHYSRVRQ